MSGERPWSALYTAETRPDMVAPAATVLDLFDASVRADQQASCLHYFGATLTRGEVSDQSVRVARVLETSGAGRGDRIGISLQNCPAFVAAVLGAWRLGAVVVPLNPMLRADELEKIVRDAAVAVVVAHPDTAPVVTEVHRRCDAAFRTLWVEPPELAGRIPLPFGPWPAAPGDRLLDLAAAEPADTGDWTSPSASDLALLTYTSGTTGPAKGAMNTHANLGYHAVSYREWFGLGDPDDAILTVAPLFHITGLGAHLALGLGNGLPMVLTYRFEPAAVLDLIAAHRPTFTIGAITAFVALLDAAADPQNLATLSTVFTGGAPVPTTVVQRYEEVTGRYIHNMYGLTETTSACIGTPLGRRSPVDASSGALSIGIPMSGVDVTIVDDAGRPLPAGQQGEIVVAGPQVCAGYRDRPDETGNAFRRDGMHTGDVGVRDEDGWIYVVDRKKDLVVVSGYKVWPRDVEDVLYAHGTVREAAVVGRPDDYRGETLHAHVSLRAGACVTTDELRTWCRERLSAYKVPTAFHLVDELPKTATGKILRRSLRDPGSA